MVEAVEEPKAASSASGSGAQPYLLRPCTRSRRMRASPPRVSSSDVEASAKSACARPWWGARLGFAIMRRKRWLLGSWEPLRGPRAARAIATRPILEVRDLGEINHGWRPSGVDAPEPASGDQPLSACEAWGEDGRA